MDRQTSVKLIGGLAIALSALLIVAGCAGRRPVTEIAQAERAVRHAHMTSEADLYAPVELSSAEHKLAEARRAMRNRDYPYARYLAEQAIADAQLAEAKADSELARAQALGTRREIEVLRSEVSAPDTVVIERQETVTRRVPSTVVVEHAVPPPAAIVVEHPRPAIPTTVIVERPAPPPASVVIEREEAVVVVPEY